MSNDLTQYLEQGDDNAALFIEQRADDLTDILVAALDEALSILEHEMRPGVLH